jgi:uracil-DNA glycosylase family 4
MTTILKQMGVQQWRLRQSQNPSAPLPEPDVVQAVSSDHSTRSKSIASASKLATADGVSRGLKAKLMNQVGATDSSPVKAASESEPQPSIKPLPSATVGSTKDISPMPVTATAVSPMPMPAVTAMPVPLSSPMQPNSAAEESEQTAEARPTAVPVMPDPIEQLDWQGLQRLVDNQSQCQSCGPANSILGSGDAKADWMFVTDAPTSTDLSSQQLFSGRAGQLYQAMLSAVGLTRESVYTTSVFKCATSDDISVIPSCEKLLHRQIELIQPKVVIAFGEFASQSVAKSNEGLESLRSQDLRCYQTKVPIVASYSLLQLLDQPTLKAGAWQDLKKCLAITQ